AREVLLHPLELRVQAHERRVRDLPREVCVLQALSLVTSLLYVLTNSSIIRKLHLILLIFSAST
ncbi:hypothetical protein TrVE_jg420, partial [Triparma verrucosa]